MKQNSECGLPVMRPLFLDAPHEERAYDREAYSYMLGDEVLVAPIVVPGTDERRVWLPEGEWVHLWTGERFSGGEACVPAPLGEPPVFLLQRALFRTLREHFRKPCLIFLSPHAASAPHADRRGVLCKNAKIPLIVLMFCHDMVVCECQMGELHKNAAQKIYTCDSYRCFYKSRGGHYNNTSASTWLFLWQVN